MVHPDGQNKPLGFRILTNTYPATTTRL